MTTKRRIDQVAQRAARAGDDLDARRVAVMRRLIAAADRATLDAFRSAGPARRARIIGKLAHKANRGALEGFRHEHETPN